MSSSDKLLNESFRAPGLSQTEFIYQLERHRVNTVIGRNMKTNTEEILFGKTDILVALMIFIH